MKHIILATLAVLGFAGTFSAFAADPVGQIISLQGDAIATRQDAGERKLALKSPIFLNDKITTRAGAKLQILFQDDSVMSQGENSEMTIDEYVYAPKEKESNRCSVRMVKGLFRLLTGKITAINPDRFQVKTRMATIGIRGCDLGFTVSELSENVYIITLHGQESVTVVARPGAGGGEWTGLTTERWDDPEVAKQHLINVLKSNRIISISQANGTSQRDLTPEELIGLIQAVTPQIPDAPGGQLPDDGTGNGSGLDGTGGTTGDGTTGGTTGDGTGGSTGDGSTGGTTGDGTGGSTGDGSTGGGTDGSVGGDLGGQLNQGSTVVQQSNQAMVDAALASGDRDVLLALLNDPLTTDEQKLAIQARLAELGAAEHQALVDAAVAAGDEAALLALLADPSTTDAQKTVITARLATVHQARVDAAIASGDTAALQALLNDPLTTPDQQQAIQSRLTQLTAVTFTPKGGGAYWSWGIWAKQGVLDKVEVQSSSVLSASDFQAIASGANMYYLYGSGDAAAVISHAGENRLVAGFADPAARANNGVTAFGCTVNVQVGADTVPSWDGQFSMDNAAGDYLRFNVDSGTIQAAGTLLGTPASYNMSVHGTPFNTITTESLSGSLVGPGGGTPPAGVIGTFRFTHGIQAVVNGIFGSDLKQAVQ